MKILRQTTAPLPFPLPENLHPVVARVYAARKIKRVEELQYGLEQLQPPSALRGMQQAVQLLSDALQKQQRILFVADFDADGATSCALGVRALRLMGAQDVRYVVPNRFEFGYGLTPEIVNVAAQQQPDLIITVDNGISSMEGVARAKQLGIQVLITDHHLPGALLPAADAIVNPNQPGDEFPSKHLAGVGVIFYVMLALRTQLRANGWFSAAPGVLPPAALVLPCTSQKNIPEPNLAQLLDLVALGTVADVVVLDHNNRVLVAQGLARIREGRCQAGLRALIEVSQRQQNRLTAGDLAFALAPRLNAAGRLEDMSLGIECLLCDDYGQALTMAQRLDELNRERRSIESEMQIQALDVLKTMRLDNNDALPYGLCLFDPDWHQGVIGILAGRIKERTHRPVIAFALSNEHEIKGSARSVEGLHIRDALDSVAAQHPGLLTKFGGHAMAAGLTLRRADYDAFCAAFDREVRKHLTETELQRVMSSDGDLSADELQLELAEALRGAGPWGQGFPEPLFDGIFEVVSQRIVGDKHLKLVLRYPDDSRIFDAIAFNASPLTPYASRLHIAYRLDVNEYRGQRSLQLLIEHLETV
ncbi:MAG: single-stranded-DNA-specific exonuclease RecJ [Gammaproteobacteria bacterium]|nr:single-stranded-DNA-specific exonuclease RecJ [Gammaproteobacteria bacterium]